MATKRAPVKLLSGGNPQIPKGEGDAPVQAYIADMPDWKRAVGERLDALADAIDVRADPQAAVAQVRALMFIERFADALHARLDG